jgi:outer membrane protein OmpA-like peptidoglycan-associated protein
MLKPSYIFLWIIFHITAIEFPNKIKKKGMPIIPVTELVNQNRYSEAITYYSSLKKVKEKQEWYSLASAFNRLGYVDTAEVLLRRMFRRFPNSITSEDKLLYSELVQRKANYLVSDSLIADLKTNSPYADQAIYSQFNEEDFLRIAETSGVFDVHLEHFRSSEMNDIYGLLKSPVTQEYFFHERQPFYSGLMNNMAQADAKPYGRVKSLVELKDTIISNSVFFPKQLWNRHLDLNEIDAVGNHFVTINNPLVNDEDKFLLNVRLMKYDTARSKIVFEEIGFDKLAYNTSGFSISPSQSACVFSSDMAGTLGMADLHIGNLVYSSGGDVEIQDFYNLGSVINSIKGEYDATFVTDDILLFVSDGHCGYGSKDLYSFHLKSNKLLNLGSQINSRYDEITPKYIDGYLYFSSNRVGNTYDIFRCALDVEGLEGILNPSEEDVIIQEPQENESLIVTTETKEKVESFKQIRKRLQDEDPRKYIYTRGVDFLLADDSVRFKLIDEIDSTSSYEDYKFMTLFHPSADIVIEAAFEKELQLLSRLLNKRSDWAVVIRSHTDSKGSERSNIKLSEDRAGFLGDYLKYLGVAKSQIIIEGLGEAYPLNHCFEGAPCTEEELAKNRRTELILIKQLK